MNCALEMADAYGVTIEYADLGEWGRTELRSEYDPHGPAIRVNRRLAMDAELIAHCIFHELYHHREAIGEVRREASRRAREAAAEAYAHAMLALR
jgi:hypothetical protein